MESEFAELEVQALEMNRHAREDFERVLAVCSPPAVYEETEDTGESLVILAMADETEGNPPTPTRDTSELDAAGSIGAECDFCGHVNRPFGSKEI